jgi:hypothetical protein
MQSAIEQLEKVTFEDGFELIGECIICTEEINVGLELTRLPCSHVYLMRSLFLFGFSHLQDWTIETSRLDFHQIFLNFERF